MKVGVIGSGYVGLVAGACFAESGNDVICADVDENKIAKLNNGEIPIYEPGLEELVENNTKAGRLTFTTDVKKAIQESYVIFIAVGTPQDHDGSADLKYVLAVAAEIGKNMNSPKIIVDKSTVPVGTADKVRAEIAKHTSIEFDVVSNPEFLKEGSAIDDFLKPDRVVIGADKEESAKVMNDLYSPFVRTGNPIFIMDVKSAEVTKYAANAMLATRITFMNEIANLCERVGANVANVRKGIGSDSRIGPGFLFPGVGYGGSCFPKDIRALSKIALEHEYEMKIVNSVDEVNEKQKERLVEKIIEHYDGVGNISGKHFALWGLAFKPKTDDMREAPSITVINRLLDLGAKVSAYDPEATEVAKSILGEREGLVFADSSYDALEDANALVIVTEWNEFRRPDFEKIKDSLKEALIFDGRNLYKPDSIKEKGFNYYSIGRKPVLL